MSDQPAVPSALRTSTGLSLLFGTALGGAGAWMLHLGTRDASLVEWECAVSTCGTNDFAGAAPMLGGVALILAAVVLTRVLRTAAGPLALLTGALAALLGWRAAVDQRLVTADSVRVWLVVAGSVAAVGAVLLAITGVRELRRSSGYWVLLGRSATWGRVTEYQNTEGRPTATVHFDDAAGNRHRVRTAVPRDVFRRPPRVYYDPVSPTDPGRLRIGLPGQPLTAQARQEQQRAIRELLPLPGDETGAADSTAMTIGPDGTRTTTMTGAFGTRSTTVAPDGTRTITEVAPDGTRTVRSSTTSTATSSTTSETITDVATALERLSALHDAGSLSDQEFAAAKAAVLGR